MGSERKKSRDRSRSHSRVKHKRKRRSASRSISPERRHARHSRSRSSSRRREHYSHKSHRSRSRDRDRKRSHSRDRGRRRSHSHERDRRQSHSHERDRKRSHSRERDRRRSQSHERDRRRSNSHERDRRRSQSHERDRRRSNSHERDRRRSQSHERDRRRSHSRERDRRRSQSQEKGRLKRRSRSREKDKGRHRSRSASEEWNSKGNSRSSSSRKYTKGGRKDMKSSRKPLISSSSESSYDSSSEDELKLLQRLQEDREKTKEDKLKQKKAKKLMETPAEKRLRRLQKKEAKERKRKEKMGWDSEYLHFTNADNPYGDNNLLDTFVWTKKLEKEGLASLARDEIEKQNRAKMEENRIELEKVKKRRQERELERQEREKMMELEQRQREAAQFSQFSRQEDQFQLEQARLRSQIRIQDGRAKPIDLLAQYVSSEGDVTAVDMHEPYTHLMGLTLVDLEDLLEDIRVYMQLEKENMNQTYWTDLTIIVQDELRRLRQRDTIEDATSHRQGIHAAVAADVSSVFQNKSLSELNKLQLNIESKLSGPTTGIDVGYWESLLSQLKAHQARARLRERHRDNLRKKLEMLKAEQGVKEEEDGQEDDDYDDVDDKVKESVEVKTEEVSEEEKTEESNICNDDDEDEDDDDAKEESVEEEEEKEKEKEQEKEQEQEQEQEKEQEQEEKDGDEWDSGCEGDTVIASAISAYVVGRYSPRLLSANKLEPGTVVIDVTEDNQRLAWARQRVVGAGQPVENVLTAEEKVMQQEAQRAMTNDEAQFSVEARLDPQHFLWSDKYRPRKPRYFNRVHTGFEWNKYNQTHYDMDNPPPKIVQGYKFNIFYPDLIDKARTPQYELIPCSDNKDFAILKFTAGPPYEAIAFKIVNREWEYSYKRGFRCQFHNNIFQLWFHFKRYRYRR